MHETELRRLRDSIDAIDQQILLLLAQRLRLVLEVGELKRVNKVDVYDPWVDHAEAERLAVLTKPLEVATRRVHAFRGPQWIGRVEQPA